MDSQASQISSVEQPWPLSAFCTASTERKRRVLMHSLSNAGSRVIAGGAVFIRILLDFQRGEALSSRMPQIGMRYP